MVSARKTRELAHRLRAGIIGLLECCRCTYPLVHHETTTGHEKTCPSHGMTLSARSASTSAGYFVAALDIDSPTEIVDSVAGGGG